MADLVPVERLTSREDRFACTPLRAVFAAKSCLARRAALQFDTGLPLHPSYVACPLGAQVAAALGDASVIACKTPGCLEPVPAVTNGGRRVHPDNRGYCRSCRTARTIARNRA